MTKVLLRLILALLISQAAVAAREARLNLFIYSEYIDPAVVAEFEKRFECKVVIDVFEEAESMMAKIQGGGVGLYDVVVAPDYIVPAMAKQKLLAPLRKEKIPNLANLDERFVNPPFDRENRHTAAYQWGTVGIYARPSVGKPAPQSWGLLFDPKLQPGPFALMDSMRDTIGAALKYKGYSLNSTNPKELKEVRDLLIDAKRRSSGFEGSVGGKNKVLGKSVKAALVYSGEGGRGMTEDKETAYFIPSEGSQIWVDSMAILAGTPSGDLAERFVNFILEAETGAKISNFTQFSSPNKAARKFIKPELLQNPVLYPPESVWKNLEFLRDLGPKAKLYDEIWTQIKSR